MQFPMPRAVAAIETISTRRVAWLSAGLLLLYFAAPWGWQHSAHAFLHGLCAQTPSHTLRFGPYGLPFDSRMTGIYGGFLSTLIVLIAWGRHRLAKTPHW